MSSCAVLLFVMRQIYSCDFFLLFRWRFAIISACLLGSTVAFAPGSSSRSSRVSTTMMAERSRSLPFLLKPVKVSESSLSSSWIIKLKLDNRRVLHFKTICQYQLDGSLAGDEGFDPLGLSNIEELGIGKITELNVISRLTNNSQLSMFRQHRSLLDARGRAETRSYCNACRCWLCCPGGWICCPRTCKLLLDVTFIVPLHF